MEMTAQQKHRAQFPYGDPRGPMRGLPAIPKLTTPSEAEQRRNQFQFPDMVPGEPVFYRRKADGSNMEEIAWYQKSYNKTATLTVARIGYVIEEKSSVSYWDHTEADPAATGDPKAPHNNNGTFRRTSFGKVLGEIIAKLGGGETFGVDANNNSAILRQELINLREEVEKLKASASDGSQQRGKK